MHTQWKPGRDKGVGVTQLAKHLCFLPEPGCSGEREAESLPLPRLKPSAGTEMTLC